MDKPQIFSALNDDQYNLLLEALPLVTVLIAGADGQIDEQELNWAEKLTSIRTYATPHELNEFYIAAEQILEPRINALVGMLPDDVAERQEQISQRLSGLNAILASLENAVAYQLYESFTSFAKHIAKASGGFLRFGSISSKEKAWIDLPMLTPVILEVEEEE